MAILKQRIQLTPDDTIVAIVAIVEKKNKYESRWQQLSQLWQFWKNPGDINCRNYGNFEDKKYTDPFSSQLLQLWQFWKRYSWLLMTAIAEKTKMNPGNNNCRNYGNSENG